MLWLINESFEFNSWKKNGQKCWHYRILPWVHSVSNLRTNTKTLHLCYSICRSLVPLHCFGAQEFERSLENFSIKIFTVFHTVPHKSIYVHLGNYWDFYGNWLIMMYTRHVPSIRQPSHCISDLQTFLWFEREITDFEQNCFSCCDCYFKFSRHSEEY